MTRRCWMMCWMMSLPLAAGSFEEAPVGAFESLESGVGLWRAEGVEARVHEGNARSGRRSLRIGGQGEGERAAVLRLAAPLAEDGVILFHAERWTARGPFAFRVDARGEGGEWREILNGDEQVRVGGFHASFRLPLPAGTRELRFRATAPDGGGVLLDDFVLPRPGPLEIVDLEILRPVVPAFIRAPHNPILGLKVRVEGTRGELALEAVELDFSGSTNSRDIREVELVAGGAAPVHNRGNAAVAMSGSGGDTRVALAGSHPLEAGEQWFWVSPQLADDSSIDGRIQVAIPRIKAGGRVIETEDPAPSPPQRIGQAVRLPGDDGSNSYRIPGIATSREGTLVAVYDIRYRNAGDLPGDIDVGVSRSTDGGQSWEPMIVAMNMGNDPRMRFDGVGDPAVLVDEVTGRIWIAALWSRGDNAWNGSGPGMTPEETGQLVLVHSDDDGVTWSEPINITSQVKDPAWRLLLNGPGAGITLSDGTLVFPAQFRAADGEPHRGRPFSTLIWSADRGETWAIGSGVKVDTTEAQLVELADGSIMINCRDNRGGSRTVAVTRDLGETWELHPTDRSALREPVCMASLFRWNHPQRGDFLWFSNPDSSSGRNMMSIKRSSDQGMTWPEEDVRLYDARGCFGYSCLTSVGEDHLGVFYEGTGSMLFLRFSLDEWED